MLKFSNTDFCAGFKVGNFSARALLREKEFPLDKAAGEFRNRFSLPQSADNVKEGGTALTVGKFWAPSPILT